LDFSGATGLMVQQMADFVMTVFDVQAVVEVLQHPEDFGRKTNYNPANRYKSPWQLNKHFSLMIKILKKIKINY
jgi:hypothetical protein